MTTTATEWYLLQCKPREDERAKMHLANQGYNCFGPTLSIERIRRGKRVSVTEPLFPGYLFISLDKLNDNWAPIRSTRGVSRFVAFNGAPLPVEPAIVADLMQREAAVGQDAAIFNEGDKLRITSGPFKELEAVFHAYDGQERVVVLLNLLQRQQRLSLALTEVATL